MKSHLGNQNGFYLLTLAIVVVVIGLITTSIILGQMNNLFITKGRTRAFYDGEVAIDSIAKRLRYAYEMAAPVAESNGTSFLSGGMVTDVNANAIQLVPSGTALLPQPYNVQFYLPSSKICVERANSFSTTPYQICLILPQDFDSLYKVREQETKVAIHLPAPSALRSSDFLDQMLHLLVPESQAQSSVSADPGLITLAPPVKKVLVKNYNPASPSFKLRYGMNDCKAPAAPNTPDRFCVSVRICVKLSGACTAGTADPFIYQTFVFMNAPLSSLYN